MSNSYHNKNKPSDKEAHAMGKIYDFTKKKLEVLINSCYEVGDPDASIYEIIYDLYILEDIHIEWVDGYPMADIENLEMWFKHDPYCSS